MKLLDTKHYYNTWVWDPTKYSDTFCKQNNIIRSYLEFNEDVKSNVYEHIFKNNTITLEALISDNRIMQNGKIDFLLNNYKKYDFTAVHLDLEFWIGGDMVANKTKAKKLVALILEIKNRLKCKIHIDLPIWIHDVYREEYEVIQPLVDEITFMAYFTNPTPINNLLNSLKSVQTKPFNLAYELGELKDSPSSTFYTIGIPNLIKIHNIVLNANISTFKQLLKPDCTIHHFDELLRRV